MPPLTLRQQPVPTHMRHGEPHAGVKGNAGAADKSQKRRIALLRTLEQKLHSKTDAQNRLLPQGEGRHPLLSGVEDGAHVYFVHSYAAPVSADTVASCSYGVDFTALVARGNFMGAQFHPERSGPVGARILGNFLALPAGGKG